MIENETRQDDLPSGSSALREIIETVLLALIIFWAINSVTGRFKIDGSSMEPNLHNGQYIIINKVTYQLHDPYRGDVVVFQYPNDPNRDFIKRVIGVPGDEVRISDGIVYVNGKAVDEPYITEPGNYSGSWTLGTSEYFVLGDNRHNSSDSHSWGPLPGNNIIGKAAAVYWPIDDLGLVPHYGELSGNTATASSILGD
ncbi:MAG: signal peptidase I [Chloroflexota bacterium]